MIVVPGPHAGAGMMPGLDGWTKAQDQFKEDCAPGASGHLALSQ